MNWKFCWNYHFCLTAFYGYCPYLKNKNAVLSLFGLNLQDSQVSFISANFPSAITWGRIAEASFLLLGDAAVCNTWWDWVKSCLNRLVTVGTTSIFRHKIKYWSTSPRVYYSKLLDYHQTFISVKNQECALCLPEVQSCPCIKVLKLPVQLISLFKILKLS